MASDRTARESYILQRLAKDGSLSVSVLSEELGVSEVTIRSQLKELEERGLLSRTWGGAQASSIRNVLERDAINDSEKDRIAKKAAELVRDGDRVMIEAGTTTARIAKFLGGLQGVQIVTNSTLVFSYARTNPDLEVILTGGSFHRESESLVGPIAQRTIQGFNARLAFVGTDGFTAERGLTTQFAEGAEIIKAMHERAEETWLTADSSKYGKAGFVSVLRLDELAGMVMDAGLAPDVKELLQKTVPLKQA
ncbi:MAG: DeoR/GlpR family DNA-binding transcription regulator [Propionibacteriaceae bacterium]|jgi:DeoR family galactitol utilization operon repressor|nr:DeoR/GlpR family DNA-binding transcription regulator [Propionibacteriaceae bacterium]